MGLPELFNTLSEQGKISNFGTFCGINSEKATNSCRTWSSGGLFKERIRQIEGALSKMRNNSKGKTF